MTNFWDLGDPKFQTPDIGREFLPTLCAVRFGPHTPHRPSAGKTCDCAATLETTGVSKVWIFWDFWVCPLRIP